MKRLLALAAIAWAVAGLAQADCRLILADQSDYYGNRGFYVDLEAITASDGLCHLNTLTMYTGVADGTAWRFPRFVPASGWQYGHPYDLVVTIGPATTTVQVNGVTVAQSPGAFMPHSGEITVNEIPGWAASTAVYGAIEGDFEIANSSGTAQFSNQAANVPADVLGSVDGDSAVHVERERHAGDPDIVYASAGASAEPIAAARRPLRTERAINVDGQGRKRQRPGGGRRSGTGMAAGTSAGAERRSLGWHDERGMVPEGHWLLHGREAQWLLVADQSGRQSGVLHRAVRAAGTQLGRDADYRAGVGVRDGSAEQRSDGSGLGLRPVGRGRQHVLLLIHHGEPDRQVRRELA